MTDPAAIPEDSRAPATRSSGSRGLPVVVWLAVGVLVLLLALPLLGLIVRVSPAVLLARLAEAATLDALRLSLMTSVAATGVVVLLGTPTAYLLATRDFRGKRWLEILIALPMVLPPTVAGFALLMAFGRMGIGGRALEALGVTLPFTTLGVIVAQVFMAAPFYIAPARAGFAGVERRLLDAAATLRGSEFYRFRRVMLPLALPALVAGIAMSGARALGEFGATITFAGNMPGITQTMPLAVYVALQSDLDQAVVLSVLLLAMSLGLLAGLRWAPRGWMEWRDRAGHPGSTPAR